MLVYEKRDLGIVVQVLEIVFGNGRRMVVCKGTLVMIWGGSRGRIDKG